MELEDELKVKSFPNVSLMCARVVTSDIDKESRAASDVQPSVRGFPPCAGRLKSRSTAYTNTPEVERHRSSSRSHFLSALDSRFWGTCVQTTRDSRMRTPPSFESLVNCPDEPG